MVLLISAGHCPLSAQASPKHPGQKLLPYLDDHVFAVVQVNITRIDVDALISTATDVLGEVLDDQAFAQAQKELQHIKPEAQQELSKLRKVGIEFLYYVFDTNEENDTDLDTDMVFVAIPISERVNEAALLKMLAGPGSGNSPGEFVRAGAFVFLGNDSLLKRLKGPPRATRPELDTIDAFGTEADVQILLIPVSYKRRILEAMLPTFSNPPLQVQKGVISNGLMWATLTIDLPPQLSIKGHIHSADSASAMALNRLLRTILNRVHGLAAIQQTNPKLSAGLALLSPELEKNGLSLTLDEKQSRDLLVNVIVPAVMETSRFLENSRKRREALETQETAEKAQAVERP